MVILNLEKIPEINKKINFKIFLTDTKQTFINRIAFSLNNQFQINTLPEYIYIPNFGFDKEILEIDDLITISKNYNDINSFTLFYRNTAKWNIKPVELFKIWVNNLSDLKSIDPEYYSFVLKYVNDNVLKLNESEFNELLQNIPNFQEEINDKIKLTMKSILEEEIKPEIKFEKIDGLNFTPFNENKRKISITLSNNFSSLFDFFDISQLNEYVPYICVKQNDNGKIIEYTKISKKFNYFPEMIDDLTNEYQEELLSNIVCYMYNLKEIKKEKSIKLYSPIEILHKKDTFKMELTVFTDQLNLDSIKNRIKNIFTQEVYFSSEENLYIGGLFYLPDIYFDKYILADLCMSDSLFEKFLKIDESLRAYRKKSSVYVYFTDPRYPTDYLTASISQKFMEKSDLKYINPENRNDFKIGKSYVRIKISKAKSLNHIYRFQKIISKLFVKYKEQVEEITDIYREFIPNFGEIPKIEIKQSKIKLKDIVPEQFISNYTRLCSKPPEIIFPENRDQYLKQFPDRQTIIFPNTSEEGKQYEYICTDDIYKFPGVKKNNLENKDKFKYLPCCYPKDQKNRTNYKDYYENIQISKDDQVKNERIILTNKFLNSDNFGILPEYLNNMFISIQPNFDFYRKGVTRTKNSFIECITEIFDPEYKQFSRDDDRIPNFLEKVRQDLVEFQSVAITRQEEYDRSIDQIKQHILDMDRYFDPKKYYRLLEEKYNCNIYLFNETEMIIPYHLQNYLRYHNRYPNSVFIFEHYGSESDNATFPQCEIISGINPKIGGNTQFYTLPYSNHISLSVEKIFIKYNQSYLYNRLSTRIKLPENLNITGQSIDGYGKTRVIYLNYIYQTQTYQISLYTTPLPPLGIKEQEVHILPVEIKIALELFKSLNIPIQHQTVIKDKCIEISGFYNNILYICPVIPSSPLNDIIRSENKQIIFKQQSQLKMFNEKYKHAKHLSQLFLYTFSVYLQELNENARKSEKFGNEIFKNFVDTYIDKIKDWQYTKFNKLISQNNHAYNNNRLIVGGKNPDETLNRLIYFLHVNLERNRDLVLNYYTKDYIYNYYDDITDFVKREDEIIIPGENALKQWYDEKNIKNRMYLQLQPEINIPYFIKSSNQDILENKVYLCNNDNNLQDCMNREYYWNKMKYNPHDISKTKNQNVQLDILRYKNMNNISRLNQGKYKVLGYLKNNKVKYTTLLNL